jgi:hypothetical protein
MPQVYANRLNTEEVVVAPCDTSHATQSNSDNLSGAYISL